VLCGVVYLSMVWDLLLLLFIAVPSTDRLAIPTEIEEEGKRRKREGGREREEKGVMERIKRRDRERGREEDDVKERRRERK
jgi:hypothetical protein